jgi:hypothetical protein
MSSDTMPLASRTFGTKTSGLAGMGKTAQGVFYADFPGRGGAQIAFVVAIQKDCGGGPAEPRGLRCNPEKCAGVDEELHGVKNVTCP